MSPIDGIWCEWSASFSLEDVASRGLALEFAKGAQLVAADGMSSWLAVLGGADVQRGGAAEFYLCPFQVADLDGAQTVPIGDEDQRGVPQPVAWTQIGRPNRRFAPRCLFVRSALFVR
jgi:hypothetical protein